MAWPDDIKSVLVGAGIPASKILRTTSAEIPTSGGPFLHIIESGGMSPIRTQNVEGDAYQVPGAQILARGATADIARALLVVAYNALNLIKNQEINGKWYVEIRPNASFIDLSEDENGRARVAFNVLGWKRP